MDTLAQTTERIPVTPASGGATAPSRLLKGGEYYHLLRAFSFICLLLALVFTLDFAISAGLRRISTSSFGVTNRIVNGQVNAELVVTGSSRALVHYDPRLLNATTGLKSYNLGRNGSQTDLQLAVLKTYLNHNAKPRLVVHNLDLYSLTTSHEIYETAQYLPYLREAPIYASVLRTYPDAWKWKHLPLYGYVVPDMRLIWLLGLKRLAGFEPEEDHIDGFASRPLEWTSDFDKFRRTHPKGVEIPIEPQGVRDLVELITVCRDHGVPLLFVYSPEYVEIQPLQRNRRAVFALFARLCEQHQVALWDYSDSDISRKREYFYNSQHLNSEGATAFSLALGQRLAASPLVAQTSAASRSANARPFSEEITAP